MNVKNCVYISWKSQILTILWYKITQFSTRNSYFLSKFSKIYNLESQFCELLRPWAPPFQKIKRSPLNQVTFRQKSPYKIDVPKCLKITVVMLLCNSYVLSEHARILGSWEYNNNMFILCNDNIDENNYNNNNT